MSIFEQIGKAIAQEHTFSLHIAFDKSAKLTDVEEFDQNEGYDQLYEEREPTVVDENYRALCKSGMNMPEVLEAVKLAKKTSSVSTIFITSIEPEEGSAGKDVKIKIYDRALSNASVLKVA